MPVGLDALSQLILAANWLAQQAKQRQQTWQNATAMPEVGLPQGLPSPVDMFGGPGLAGATGTLKGRFGPFIEMKGVSGKGSPFRPSHGVTQYDEGAFRGRMKSMMETTAGKEGQPKSLEGLIYPPEVSYQKWRDALEKFRPSGAPENLPLFFGYGTEPDKLANQAVVDAIVSGRIFNRPVEYQNPSFERLGNYLEPLLRSYIYGFGRTPSPW